MYYESNSTELYHHGVKGMKWGVRKKTYASDVQAAKSKLKTAKKEYNKSFNKAYNRAAAAYSPFKKHRDANDKRWQDAYDKADAYEKARKEYKMAKKSYNELVKTEVKKIKAGESFIGKLWGDFTGLHKIQAELNIDSKRRTKG